MLYQAIYVAPGQPVLPREVVRSPELARYVAGWGQAGDAGLLATDAATGQRMGAVWLRLLGGNNKGYGYVDAQTPELSMAVLPDYRGQGIGTQLLRRLFVSDWVPAAVSLSVSAGNPALQLYQRFGFEKVGASNESFTLKRNLTVPL